MDKDKRFILWMACGIVLLAFGYVFCVTFIPIPQSGADHAKTITGFILGVCLATIITYFWGSSKGSADKTAIIDKMTMGPPAESK